jgi:hypothetical protein
LWEPVAKNVTGQPRGWAMSASASRAGRCGWCEKDRGSADPAGDDEAGVGGKRAGEHLIVVGIATDWGDLGGAHELCEGAVTGEQLGDLHLGF